MCNFIFSFLHFSAPVDKHNAERLLFILQTSPGCEAIILFLLFIDQAGSHLENAQQIYHLLYTLEITLSRLPQSGKKTQIRHCTAPSLLCSDLSVSLIARSILFIEELCAAHTALKS